MDIDTVGPAANAAESGTQQVTATITDDEDASITVAESGGSTDVNEESATSDTYTIVLTSKPTDDVTIAISSADETEGATVDPSSVTFNPGAPNPWNTPQTVTVTAVDDGVVEVNPHTVLITNGAASSSDGDYNTLNPDDVTANISDND